jgi:hypothetical protein
MREHAHGCTEVVTRPDCSGEVQQGGSELRVIAAVGLFICSGGAGEHLLGLRDASLGLQVQSETIQNRAGGGVLQGAAIELLGRLRIPEPLRNVSESDKHGGILACSSQEEGGGFQIAAFFVNLRECAQRVVVCIDNSQSAVQQLLWFRSFTAPAKERRQIHKTVGQLRMLRTELLLTQRDRFTIQRLE